MIIAGAKGFAVQLFDALYRSDELENLSFFDDTTNDCTEFFLHKYPIFRNESAVKKYFDTIDNRFVLGTGGSKVRRMFYEKFITLGGLPYTVIDKTVLIGSLFVEIGHASCILANSVVESTVFIGKGCLINLNVLITHGTTIGNFCELSPGVRISGNCKLGDNVFVGTGAILLPQVIVGNNCKIGAGAVVNRDIPDNTTVVGVPAKRLAK